MGQTWLCIEGRVGPRAGLRIGTKEIGRTRCREEVRGAKSFSIRNF